jgi:predicted AlkP superfamily phosphohydrolase/phosphomutase
MVKIVLIGLDGGTLDLMEPWVKDGYLPNFSQIIKEGAYGKLRSTTPYYSAPAWVSMVTGVNPGKHGIYDFFHTDCFKKKIVNSIYRKTPAIWKLLTDADLNSIVVNVPGSYPPEKIKGIMITGLLTPSPKSDFTYPKEIKKELVDEKLGRYELEQVAVDDIPKNLTAKYAPEKLAEQVNLITSSHGNVTLNLMKKYDWDFTMVVFRGTDDVQHLLWNRQELILSCYKKVDEYIGKMMKDFPDAFFIIVSDHGFGKPDKYFYINNALYNAGYLKTSSDPYHSLNSLTAMLFDKFSKAIFHFFPMQKIVRSTLGRKFILTQVANGNIDFSKTKAFYHSVCSRGIRINLKDKYKEGIIEKDEYENLRNELIEFLKSVKDPNTGEFIIENIYKGEEIYGENAVNDPLDIVFDLKENYSAQELIQPIGGFKTFFQDSKKLSEISDPGFYDWVGDHRPYGILFMYGKNIKPVKVVNASIVDIVPTILASLNQPIPNYIDGKVISDAFIKKPNIIRKDYPNKSLLSDVEIDRIRKLREQL